MSAALDRIRAKVGPENCVESCDRDGCRVDMAGVPADRVIVDADKAFPAHKMGGKRCDFVLFTERDDERILVVPIELKSGKADSSEAVKQLQGGAKFAEQVGQLPPNAVCRPVLIHGRGLHRAQLKTLGRNKVVFRGYNLTVMTARCGEPRNLASALEGSLKGSLEG